MLKRMSSERICGGFERGKRYGWLVNDVCCRSLAALDILSVTETHTSHVCIPGCRGRRPAWGAPRRPRPSRCGASATTPAASRSSRLVLLGKHKSVRQITIDTCDADTQASFASLPFTHTRHAHTSRTRGPLEADGVLDPAVLPQLRPHERVHPLRRRRHAQVQRHRVVPVLVVSSRVGGLDG